MPAGLLETLHDLKAAEQVLRHAIERPPTAPPLVVLSKSVADLGQDRPTRSLICPEEYRAEWRRYLAGEPRVLGTRAIRYLTWEPDVVLDARFHYYLDERSLPVGARSLQGLVRACHIRWSAFVANETMKRIALRRLREYRGTNRIVTSWQAVVDRILDASAPNSLADWMLAYSQGPQSTADAWNIDSGSQFFLEAMRALLKKARQRWKDGPIVAFVCGEILAWNGWPPDIWKSEIADSVLHSDARDPQVNGPLKRFILQHARLGDPRLPSRRTNWLGVRQEARQRFIEWLSRDDIIFFFDHAFPKGGDPHRRKPFWLKYVSRVVQSRPLLSWEDQARLEAHLRRLGGEVGNFGRINGMSSAFLLDFGDLCAIEFNRVGNACYIYSRQTLSRIIADFWAPGLFTESRLKNQDLCLARVVHRQGWEEELQAILARYGIRPQ